MTWNKGETTGQRESIKQDTIATMEDRSNKEVNSIAFASHTKAWVRLVEHMDNEHPLKRTPFEFCIISADYEMARYLLRILSRI